MTLNFIPQPVNVSGITDALGQLAQVNAQNAALDRQERERRRNRRERVLGAVGAVTGGALGYTVGGPGGALALMNVGQQLGRGAGGGEVDPVALTSGALSGYNVYQGQQAAAQRAAAAAAVRSALSPSPVVDETGREAVGAINPQRLTAALAIDPSMLPTAVQTGVALRGQDIQTAQSAQDRALRLRGQDITLQGQKSSADVAREGHQVTRETSTERIASQQEIAKANREAADLRAKAQADAQLALEKFKLDNKGKTPGEIVGGILQREIDNPGSTSDVEKQVIEVWKKGDPFRQQLAGENKLTPAFNPKPEAQKSKPAVVPESLKAIPNLQFSPKQRKYRDPATGREYDENGNPL